MHIQVFYIGGSTGWAFARFDDLCNQVSEAEFFYHKSDAIEMAQRDADEDNLVVEIYTADGKLQRKLT